MTMHTETANNARLSEAIRAATMQAHGTAQTSAFMGDLFKGVLSRERYGRYVVQLRAIYAALEQAAARWQDDPVAGPFVHEELRRLDVIDGDLRAILGDGWQSGATLDDVTREYGARLEGVAMASPIAFVAHHYVRYMGDLSGGQAIRKVVERDFGEGTANALQFAGIPDVDAFKQAYRQRLDDAPWDAAEKQRVIDEILIAYGLNTRLLAAM